MFESLVLRLNKSVLNLRNCPRTFTIDVEIDSDDEDGDEDEILPEVNEYLDAYNKSLENAVSHKIVFHGSGESSLVNIRYLCGKAGCPGMKIRPADGLEIELCQIHDI
jgi:hypothetical protein